MKTAAILCAMLLIPGAAVLSDTPAGSERPGESTVLPVTQQVSQAAPVYHQHSVPTAPNAIQADAQRMGLPVQPSRALTRAAAYPGNPAPRQTRRMAPHTGQYGSPQRGNTRVGGTSYGQSGFGGGSSGYTGGGIGGQGRGRGPNQGYGGGGFGGGGGYGGGQGNFGGGAVGFSNISELFRSIDDAAVGEWPPPLLGPVHIQRQYPHRR